VIAGVANFQTWVIVALMGSAFAVVAVTEWLASRARFVPPAVAFLPPLEDEGEPAPYVETSPWAAGPAALGPAEDTEADDGALTVIEVVPEDESIDDDEPEDEADAPADPWEQGGADLDDEPEAELAERGGLFRRRRR
jgi:hypothetical protein